MDRPPSCCDFCGRSESLQEYPTDHGIVNWYVCADCARMIDTEQWDQLIDRSFAAYTRIRAVPDSDEPVLRQQVESLVHAFRAVRLAAA